MTTTDQPTELTQARLTGGQLAQRNTEIVRMKDAGASFAEVGERFGISRQTAHDQYWKTVAAVPQAAVAEMRAEQNARLQWLMEQAAEVLTATHYAHSGGTLLYGPHAEGETPQPLLDTGPKLAAIREIRALVETQAKLNGTNAPAQVTVNGQISFVINNVDMGNLS